MPANQSVAALREWAITAIALALLLVYASAFWGQAARLLPAPLDEWHDVMFRLLAGWRHHLVSESFTPGEAAAIYRAGEAYVAGLLVPLIVLRASGREPRDVGLGMPAPGTAWPGLALASPALAGGIFLSAATPSPWGSALYEVLELAAMLPEHLLVFGAVTAVMLPGWRLGGTNIRPDDATRPATHRMSLVGRELAALAVSGIVFQILHLGAPTLELLLALPVGLLFAWATLYSQSIWPALIIHWMLNLVPMAGTALLGAAN